MNHLRGITMNSLLSKIEELHKELLSLYNELEAAKMGEIGRRISDGGLSEILSKAKLAPINNHPMGKCDEHMQRMYLLLLITVADIDNGVYSKSLDTIGRIAFGMNYQGDIEEILISARKISSEKLNDCISLFKDNDLKVILIMECLLISAAFDNGKRDAMKYISDIGCLLGLDKDNFEIIANFARAVLSQNPEEYRCELKNVFDCLDCYIDIIYKNRDMNIQVLCIDLPCVLKKSTGNCGLYKIEVKEGNEDIEILGHYKNPVSMFPENQNISKSVSYIGKLLLINKPEDKYLNRYRSSNREKRAEIIKTERNRILKIPFALAADSFILYNRAYKIFCRNQY